MATFKKTRVGGKLVKQLALAAALCASSLAHAGVINFEGERDMPFVFANEEYNDGKHWMLALGGTDGDMAGMFINGAEQTDICDSVALSCPKGNTSSYYAALADSYLVFGLNSGGNFRLDGFSAGFIGTGSASFTRGLLVLQGFGQDGFALGSALQVGLGANFSNYNLAGFFDTSYAAVRVLGYGCDASGSCFRSQNASNFGIDNIRTTEIPEPATFGLFGLGLLGMGAFLRKRVA